MFKRLILENWCQHEHLTVDFTAGLNAITGRNGSGKSNVLHAIRFALTGDTVRDLGVKAEHIRDAMPEKGRSRVTLVLDNRNGDEVTISRNASSSFASYTDSEGEVTKTAAQVNQKVSEEIAEMRLISEYTFVDQGEFIRWLTAKPKERSEWFATLFGVGNCENQHSALGSLISQESTSLEEDDKTSRDDIMLEVSEATRAITDTTSRKGDLQKDVLPSEDSKKLEDKIAQYEKVQSLVQDLSESKKELQGFEESATDLEASLSGLESAEKSAGVRSQELGRELLELSDSRDSLDQVRNARSRYVSLKLAAERDAEAYQDCEDRSQEFPENPLPDIDRDEFTRAVTRKSECEAALESYKDDSDDVPDKCPMCLTDLTEDHFDHLQSVLTTANDIINHYQDRVDAEDALASSREKALARLPLLEANSHNSKEAYENEDEPPEEDPEEVKLLTDRILELTRRSDVAKTDYEDAQIRRDLAERSAIKARAQQETIEARLAKLRKKSKKCCRPEAYAKGVAAIAHSIRAEGALSEVDETLKSQTSILQSAERRLTEFDTRELRMGKTREWLDEMAKVRKFLHRDSGPRRVIHSGLATLESKIETVLTWFNNPFTMKTNADLTYTVRKSDGEERAARRLSGGEKTVASLAFWLGIHEHHASSLNVMCLDEPTQNMDEENIELLAGMLEKLHEVTHDRDFQLIMVTHERELDSIFDNLIKI